VPVLCRSLPASSYLGLSAVFPPSHVRCRCCFCRGGCDNCSAAEAGGGAERDLAPQARTLLATVQVRLDGTCSCPLCSQLHLLMSWLTGLHMPAANIAAAPCPPACSGCARWGSAQRYRCCGGAGAWLTVHVLLSNTQERVRCGHPRPDTAAQQSLLGAKACLPCRMLTHTPPLCHKHPIHRARRAELRR
jgi:hypothetical protein